MFNFKLVVMLSLMSVLPEKSVENYNLGDKIENFTLENIDGKMVSLSDYSSEKGIILIFDCNTCPYSQAYLKRIKALHANYASKGYPVVAINPNDPNRSPGDSQKKMITYAGKNGYEHAYLRDADQSVAKAFGATNTPHVFILQNTKGDMVLKYIGAIDNNTQNAEDADKKYVEDAINALLEGKNPPTTKTKAIGCTIKWKA